MSALLRLLALAALLIGCSRPPPLLTPRPDRPAEPLELRLVRITPDALEPARTFTVPEGSGVAFLNDTREAALGLVFPEVELEAYPLPGSAAVILQRGTTRLAEPLPPGGVVALRVAGPGAHRFEVHGLPGPPLRGSVIVLPSTPPNERAERGRW